MSLADKHKLTVDSSLVRLVSRAADSRGLNAMDLSERVVKSIEKYILRNDENISDAEIKEFVDSLRADDLC